MNAEKDAERRAYEAACLVQMVSEALNAEAMGTVVTDGIPAAACIALDVVSDMLEGIYNPMIGGGSNV